MNLISSGRDLPGLWSMAIDFLVKVISHIKYTIHNIIDAADKLQNIMGNVNHTRVDKVYMVC